MSEDAATVPGIARSLGRLLRGDADSKLSASNITGILARGALSAFAIQGIGMALQYAINVLLARWMGAAQFGLYSLAFSWNQFLVLAAAIGFPVAVLRYVPEYSERSEYGALRGFVRTASTWAIASGTVIGAAGIAVVLLMHVERGLAAPMIAACAAIPIFAVSNVTREVIRATRRIVLAYLPPNVAHPALFLAVAFVAVKFEPFGRFDATQALLALAACMGLIQIFQWKNAQDVLPAELASTVPQYRVREWISVAVPLLLVQQAIAVLNQADIIMIGMLKEPTDAAYYAAAVKTGNLGRFALVAINTTAAPMIAALYTRGELASLQRLVARVARWAGLISAVLLVVLLMARRPVLGMFGQDFVVGSNALILTALAQLMNSLTGPAGLLLSLTGYHRLSLRIYASAAAINVALNLVLIPSLGITGAALATLISVVLWNGAFVVVVRRSIGVLALPFSARSP